jgi:hypothetical protein
MSSIGGPNIVDNGLVTLLDVANIKSFRGEPTVNLVISPKTITTGYATTVPTRTNNVLLNFDNTFTAGIISGSGFFAYVSAPTTNGNRYTTSWYVKAGTNTTAFFSWGGAHQGNRTNFTFNLLTGEISSLTLASGEAYGADNIGNDWWRVWYSSTLSSGNNYYPQLNNGSGTMYVGALQIENKPYSTPFVNGTRGSTVATGGGLFDMTYNSTNGQLFGTTYDSNNLGSLDFDGTDDYYTITQPAITTSPNSWTISLWMNPGNQSSRFITPQSNGIDQYLIYNPTNQGVQINVATSADTNERRRSMSVNTVPLNKWTFLTISLDNLTIKMYSNGILRNTFTETLSIANWTTNWVVGQRGNSTFWYLGKMSNLMVYNRSLSNDEVLQNYNSTKGRFGL